MVKIVKRHTRVNDPEVLAEAKAAKAIGYRHHIRRKNGQIESVIVAPGAKDADEVRTNVSASRYLYMG